MAASLDDLYRQQKEITISPVEINGQPVVASDVAATVICKTLGYTRVVGFKYKAHKGKALVPSRVEWGSDAFELLQSEIVLIELTCA